MLEVKDVNQFYGGSHILRDVSFQALWGVLRGAGAEWRRENHFTEMFNGDFTD
jgi:hypothetical protein